jgi:hypothetical protein
LSFQYYRLHSTLFRDIDESLLYSTDSDEEDPHDAEEINSSFLGRTVTQVSGQMLKGSPSTQQAALSILADLAMPDNNVSKIIVSSKAVNGTPTQGMSQDTCKLLLHSKKITKSG